IGTQSGGLRPFGVSLLVGGVDEDGEVRLFLTEPYGLYFQYRAAVVGDGEAEIEAMLNKRYKSTMSVDEGLKFGLSLMKEFLKEEYNVERVDAAFIDDKNRRFTKLSNDELRKLMK
ncbi:MAG: proteasome subunit alpha, partial [Nanoarchaeota archaeon]|nr:proteasome subunit alpha [Nanoarchaeota archaeon]